MEVPSTFSGQLSLPRSPCMKLCKMRPLDLQCPAQGVGRTSVEESTWFELMMHFHEVLMLIKVAALLRRANPRGQRRRCLLNSDSC
jgi:predicted Fe-S protein YdhL (DUF1289 family)